MSGISTRGKDDLCNRAQDTMESTRPGDYRLYLGAQIPCNPICKPANSNFNGKSAPFVDVESELRGLSRINSKCNGAKYPFWKGNGSIKTDDPSVPNHITPWACERDIVPTNLKPFRSSGLNEVPQNFCAPQKFNVEPHYYY